MSAKRWFTISLWIRKSSHTICMGLWSIWQAVNLYDFKSQLFYACLIAYERKQKSNRLPLEIKRIDDKNHTIFILTVSSVSRGRSRSSEESFVQVFFITSRESQKRTSRIVDVHKSVFVISMVYCSASSEKKIKSL